MRVVLIGAGGIGAPVAIALAEAGLRELLVVDDDTVELSNLHRQILFSDADVGAPKLTTFVTALEQRFPQLSVTGVPGRALPSTVMELVAAGGVVVDATDNFPSRFLLADAAHLAGVPIVHAAAVRWQATVMPVAARGAPCYRCLFEDLPTGPVADCATAGVMGPVCGVSGAVAADRALRILSGDGGAFGHIVTFDGRCDQLREVKIHARDDCPLCSKRATIGSIHPSRYTKAGRDAPQQRAQE